MRTRKGPLPNDSPPSIKASAESRGARRIYLALAATVLSAVAAGSLER
jgi:hypothetical protein